VGQGVETLDLLVQNSPSGTDYSIVSVIVNVGIDGGTPNYPNITGGDVTVSGTLFASNNNGNQQTEFSNQVWKFQTITSSGTVQLNTGQQNTLVQLTIDTTGSLGDYTLNLTTGAGDSHFHLADNSLVTIPFSGTITVVPEPNAGVAIGCVLLGAVAFLRRNWLRSSGLGSH
jgi:hypothetical protein